LSATVKVVAVLGAIGYWSEVPAADPDGWSGVVWHVNMGYDESAGNGATAVICPTAPPPSGTQYKPCKFRLVPQIVNDEVAYYDLKYTLGEMNDDWRAARFFPRGRQPLDPLTTPLAAWNQNNLTIVGKYKQAADLGSDGGKPTNALRLEGDIQVDGRSEAVVLVRIPKAIGGTKDLLVIRLIDTPAGSATRQNGIGHGDPH